MFKVNADAYARLIEFLAEDRARSYQDLAELTGLHYRTVLDYVNALHRRRQVYIVRYAADSRGQFRIPMFLLGNQPDAVRPRMTDAQRQQARRDRLRAAGQLGKGRSQLPKRMPPNSVFAMAAG